MKSNVRFGVYVCHVCGAKYMVNQAHTWNRCTPTTCHECSTEQQEDQEAR
jgi:DNA-directed RNA polymerase subunit RPC12/RpoP